MKLNLGAGNKKYDGFINLDKYKIFKPDILHDLEIFPYPIKDNEVNEIKLYHVLEHLGQHPETFNNIIKEIYRICSNEAIVDIRVPHPRHNHFLADPTHVRPITTEGLQLYDKELNNYWKSIGLPNSQLANIHNINFKIIYTNVKLEKKYYELLINKKINEKDIEDYIEKYNNIIIETQYHLKVIK